jgi:hypothetical protein
MISFINRDTAQEHLELVERHVVEGRLRVAAQVALTARLEGQGRDTDQAKMLLHRLEETLALQIQTRSRIAQELSGGM